MTHPAPKCLCCGGDMQQGYIPDRNLGWYDPGKWFEGDLAVDRFGGVKKRKENRRRSRTKCVLSHTRQRGFRVGRLGFFSQ